MDDKLYQEQICHNLNNNIYNGTVYTKPVPDNNTEQYYSYSNIHINNSYNQNNNMLDSYSNIITPQIYNNNRNQNSYTSIQPYSDHVDTVNWENRISDVEKALRIPEKIEMIEITSKDLSPASYCSNLDFFLPDFYKNITKDMNCSNKYDSQWLTTTNGNYNQKSTEFSSCAQANQNNLIQEPLDKTVKYCSIQKTQEFDSVMKNYMYNNDVMYNDQNFYYKTTNKTDNVLQQDYNMYSNYYDNSKLNQDSIQNTYYELEGCTNNYQVNMEHQTDCSNDESDIIVEESEDDIGDCNEYQEKFSSPINRCMICNLSNTHLGTQFYILTTETPLTMSSQRPVYYNLIKIVGNLNTKCNYLCSECLGLINTIDHLQFKLSNFKNELLMKFEKTCQDNKILYSKTFAKPKKKKLKKIPKYKCKFCRKVLSLRQFCRNHLKRHKVTGLLCEICGKISNTWRNFKLHRQNHKLRNISKIESFKCSNCQKAFRTKSNLKEHENFCLGILPFSCKHQFCDKKFASVTKLKNHIKLKHDKKFIAICSICNIGFIKVSDYKSHMITHSTEKKFACSKCDKSYKTLSNLNFHMKIHNNKLPFICNICNKGFMRKEYLESHINNHNGIKNFTCNICNKKFVAQKNLDSHLKYHDGSVKTKTCNICGKTISSGFEEHLRIHNNLREFECDQCNQKFNTKGTLTKHKKLKHNSSNSVTDKNKLI